MSWMNMLHDLTDMNAFLLDVQTDKLSHAKEENLDMNQMLEQTLLELNNMWTTWSHDDDVCIL